MASRLRTSSFPNDYKALANWRDANSPTSPTAQRAVGASDSRGLTSQQLRRRFAHIYILLFSISERFVASFAGPMEYSAAYFYNLVARDVFLFVALLDSHHCIKLAIVVDLFHLCLVQPMRPVSG